MRILTLCERGLNRSVTAKYLLGFDHEVIAAGLDLAPATLDMLYAWAERIVLLDARFAQGIPADKLLLCNVGPDHYPYHYNPELLACLRPLLSELV
jgi:hypothetical protein